MAPVTVETMVRQALGRVGDVTDTYPSTRGPMYRRIGVRQRQIFAHVAQVNPDYYGANTAINLVAGVADLTTLDELPEVLQRVEIANPGTSAYAVGREVAIVSLTDPDGELAPRVTFRQSVLAQVGSDLVNVASLRVWHSRMPASIAVNDSGGTFLLLDQPWDALLELDLAGWVVGKASAIPADVRAAALAMFKAEETQLVSDFDAHLKTVAPVVQRFLSPLARTTGLV